MRKNHVKEQIKQGKPSLGAWLSLPSTASARVMARLGFDWLLVDMEHSAQNPTLMADMVGIVADAGISAPFVRIPYNSIEWFKWALDAGAWGILVPMVNTREEALRAVDSAKYPPAGNRSIGGAFAPYGFGTTNRPEYNRSANDEILVMVQIESAPGLQNVDGILSVPGVDIAFVGPNDLHAQLGLLPSYEGAEPEFVAALERIQASAREHNVATGIMCGDGASAAARVGQGFQMVCVVTDISIMAAAATQNLRIARGEQ
jgi:4-hydroxy-2-oxoheptanedioate aldolase